MSSFSSFSTTTSQTAFWNRIESQPGTALASNAPILQSARILSLSHHDDPNNVSLHEGPLPEGATVVGVGSTLAELGDLEQLKVSPCGPPNVVFVSSIPNARQLLAEVLVAVPSIQWVHARSAGIDFITSNVLIDRSQQQKRAAEVEAAVSRNNGVSQQHQLQLQHQANNEFQVTNAKGCFSSTLAEYSLMACSFFAKDLPRLLQQQRDKNWNSYTVLELRGATLGIIGYGDIGRTTAKLAKAYGMTIIGLKRTRPTPRRRTTTDNQNHNTEPSPQDRKTEVLADPYCDRMDYYDDQDPDALNRLFAQSDYVLCSLPLTPDTRGMITREHFFQHAKKDCVFVNVGRGPIVDEAAMIDALKSRRIKGAGLDVVALEPLPMDSPLWGLDNVLLSP
jgi:phosphoglycerate dehydrogenase-like enzyme